MVRLEGAGLSYGSSGAVLRDISFAVAAGGFRWLLGPSGAGKSSLLRLLYLAQRPTAGRVFVLGQDVAQAARRDLPPLRRQIGVVFQDFRLMPHLSAFDNVALPLRLAGRPEGQVQADVGEMIRWVGLQRREGARPAELSGGEQQRVAIATALANHPRIILADEPTGELDSRTAADILRVLQEARRQLGVTVIVVTHDQAVGAVADRMVAIRDGRTSSERLRVEPQAAGGPGAADTAREYAVVDRAGRLQIPQDYLRAAGITDRAALRLEGGRIIVEPAPVPPSHAGRPPAGTGQP